MHKILILVFFVININSMTIDNLDDIRADWDIFSDRVMGGISEVYFYEMEEGGKSFYRLEGNVSTANNGGFIQSVAKIKDIDEEYKGIRITVRGSEDKYYVWIRTPACRFPWDRYLVSFTPSKNWSTIEVPFSDFQKSNFYMRKKMNISRIKTVALAAYGKDFNAQLDIANIEFYK